MTKDEMKNKYTAFITEISEILGLGKPIDILKLCATTDLFFQPLEKRIAELEKENAELKGEADNILDNWCRGDDPCPHLKKRDEQLIKAKKIIRNCLNLWNNVMTEETVRALIKEAEQFIKEVEK